MGQFSEVSKDGAQVHRGAAVRRRVRVAAMGVSALAITLVASGCTVNEAFFLDLPEPATKEAAITQNLWQGSWIAAWAVGGQVLLSPDDLALARSFRKRPPRLRVMIP